MLLFGLLEILAAQHILQLVLLLLNLVQRLDELLLIQFILFTFCK
jgi:hypothetical protein